MGKIAALIGALLMGTLSAKGNEPVASKVIIDKIPLSGIMDKIEHYPWAMREEAAKILREGTLEINKKISAGKIVRSEGVIRALGAPDASTVLPRKASEPDKGFVLIYFLTITTGKPNNNDKTSEFYFRPNGELRVVRVDGKKIRPESRGK